MRVTVVLLFLALAPVSYGQQEDTAPPRLKRGQPKPTDARGVPTPEQKPVPDARPIPETQQQQQPVRVVVSDEDGNVVTERGLPASATRSATPVDDTIAQARRVSYEFQEKIPNFICDQITFRHEGEGWPKPVFKLKDRITAELMFNDGAESYRNVKASGKLLGIGKNKPPEQTGNWSTGDWISITLDVLQLSTDATFAFTGEDTIGGRKARRYKLTVRQANSHWRVEPEGYRIKPAYRGAVWIDAESFRVLRVEMEARDLPKDFPLNIVEMTTELGPVTIAGQSYLLPVHSANLSCQRDTVTCHKNELEYRNYRKFGAESTISTTDSSVTFDGEEGAKKPVAAAEPPAITNEKPKKKK
jgi:hypothetical protein